MTMAHATASQHPVAELESSILQHLLASGGASYICNTAFAAKEHLQLPHSAFPAISQACGKKVSLDVDRELHLQGLPIKSLHRAKQAWQKLLLERLHYLQGKGLNAQHRQVGLDDLLHPWFQQSSIKSGEACLEVAAIPQCRTALQRGAAPALRPRLWAAALALDLEHEFLGDNFENLCSQVEECNLLTDLLIEQDLETVANSEHFFLFEESLRAVLLAASRDPSLGPSCHHKPFPCLLGKTASGETQGAYPSSGLLPCRGLVEYAAPLCYLYAEQASCAVMFSSMYARFWCRLHTIDNSAGKDATLVSLCVLFLHLLEEGEAEVADHLKAVGCPPLQLALPWIMTAFAGHLAVGEVLLLWDRIIGFDSLLPLPLLAVAVIAFRRQVLLAADSREQIMSIMEDLSQLKIVPLLQGILFGR
ncbi:hypothetical protein WJX82_009498 [Trebouxia sp. C0006]